MVGKAFPLLQIRKRDLPATLSAAFPRNAPFKSKTEKYKFRKNTIRWAAFLQHLSNTHIEKALKKCEFSTQVTTPLPVTFFDTSPNGDGDASPGAFPLGWCFDTSVENSSRIGQLRLILLHSHSPTPSPSRGDWFSMSHRKLVWGGLINFSAKRVC